MGTCYYLIKLDKNEFYELGKNFLPFAEIDYRKPFVLAEITNETDFFHSVRRAVDVGWSFETESIKFRWCLKISKEMLAWAGSDRVIVSSDSNDSFDLVNGEYILDEWLHRELKMQSDLSKPYKQTGTRYQE